MQGLSNFKIKLEFAVIHFNLIGFSTGDEGVAGSSPRAEAGEMTVYPRTSSAL
jgi:hypothetical protein